MVFSCSAHHLVLLGCSPREGPAHGPPYSGTHRQGDTSQLLVGAGDISQQGWGLPAIRPAPDFPQRSVLHSLSGQSRTNSDQWQYSEKQCGQRWTRMDEERASPRSWRRSSSSHRKEHWWTRHRTAVGGRGGGGRRQTGGFKLRGQPPVSTWLQVPMLRPCLQVASVPTQVHSPLFTFSKKHNSSKKPDLKSDGSQFWSELRRS